jgi:hypothetical protein
MNQKIEQLAEEAGLNVILDQHAHEYGNGTLTNTSYPEVAKFAELIVKECAQVADAKRPGYIGCGYITKTTGMRIKEHFGVEQ